MPDGLYRFTSTGRPKKVSSRKRPRSNTDDDSTPDSKKSSSKKSVVSGPEPRVTDGPKAKPKKIASQKACSDDTPKDNGASDPPVIDNDDDIEYTELNSVEKSEYIYIYS